MFSRSTSASAFLMAALARGERLNKWNPYAA